MPAGISSNSRDAAIRKGLTTYQGQGCTAGHDGMRYVSNRACVECVKNRERLSYDKGKAAERKRAYRAKLKARSAADIGADILESL